VGYGEGEVLGRGDVGIGVVVGRRRRRGGSGRVPCRYAGGISWEGAGGVLDGVSQARDDHGCFERYGGGQLVVQEPGARGVKSERGGWKGEGGGGGGGGGGEPPRPARGGCAVAL
jgi:hypothetical protein